MNISCLLQTHSRNTSLADSVISSAAGAAMPGEMALSGLPDVDAVNRIVGPLRDNGTPVKGNPRKGAGTRCCAAADW
jgi:hypothetical protein